MGKKRGLGVPEASGYPAKPVLIPVRVSRAAPGGHGYSLAAGTWWPSPALPVLESLREANAVPPASDGGPGWGAQHPSLGEAGQLDPRKPPGPPQC